MLIRRFILIGLAAMALLVTAMPSFAYEEDTHFLLTYVLCRSAGFTDQESLTVAAVDQGVDDSPGTVANGGIGGIVPNVPEEWLWHALDLDGNMGPAGILQRKEQLFNIALSRSDTQDKLIYLGVFFHYQQDTWAHRHHYDGSPHSYSQFTTYNTPIGHARHGHQPDRPPFDPVCAILDLEDGIKYANDFLKRGLGRQPNAFLANYSGLGGRQDDNWSDKRKGKYFHQLAAEGAPGSPRKFLIDLVRAQINAYSSSFDANPAFLGRDTADEVNLDHARSALQSVCKSADASLGYSIVIPTKQQKFDQGFTGLTTSRLAPAAPSLKNYIVHIKTGDVFLAGTDANVKLVLNGSLRTSQGFLLNPMISGNAFERNQLDTVTLSGVQDVGDIKSITISHDNSGIGPGWNLAYVEVTVDGKTKRFNYNNWLDSDHGLSKTLR